MDQAVTLPGEPIFQLLLAFAVVAAIVGAVSSSIRELAGGYWILAWAALLVTGALRIAEGAGYPFAGYLAHVTDAIFAPLMLMGALELRADRPAPRWPILVGLAAGLIRIPIDMADWRLVHALHGAVIAPAFFVAAAVATFRAPPTAGFRVSIGILLSAMVGVELWDAWADWSSPQNQILWGTLAAICVPLAVLQIASRLIALSDGIVSAQAASDLAARELDLERWRFEVVFDEVRELVAELESDTRILFVNGRVRDLMGLEPGDLVGKRAIEFAPEEHRFAAEEIWREQIKLGGLREPVVFPVQDRNGAPLYLEITVSDYHFPDEKRLLVIARDVTDRQRVAKEQEDQNRLLEERVAERTEQLEASLSRLRDQDRLAAVGTLASGIAHQINNPVGAISAAAEFALLSGDEEDVVAIQKESLTRILDEARRTGRIVKSILRFARHGSSAKWPEDLGSVVRRSTELVRPYVMERGGSLEVAGTSKPLPVMMSPIEIEQMVVNLLRNAAESREGGARVWVSTRIEGTEAVLEVRDDGRGITPEAKLQIFDPFYTTRLREGGSGLGLSVVHGIVTDHGGEIEIDSGVDRGTCVRIRLELVDGDAGPSSQPTRDE